MQYTYSEQRKRDDTSKQDAIAIIALCAIVLGSLLGAFVAMT